MEFDDVILMTASTMNLFEGKLTVGGKYIIVPARQALDSFLKDIQRAGATSTSRNDSTFERIQKAINIVHEQTISEGDKLGT